VGYQCGDNAINDERRWRFGATIPEQIVEVRVLRTARESDQEDLVGHHSSTGRERDPPSARCTHVHLQEGDVPVCMPLDALDGLLHAEGV
jgi:hypothetical protein